jgi:hypothetical protein
MKLWRKTMKETNVRKSEDASASRAMVIKRAWIEREKASGEARRILGELEGWLVEHSASLKAIRWRTRDFSAEVQQLIGNGGTTCIETNEAVLAAQLMAGKSLAKIIEEEQNMPQMKRIYGSINFSRGFAVSASSSKEDLALYKQIDAERAAVQILKVAIALQKKKSAAGVASSMENFSQIVAKIRSETARDVLAALAEIRRLVEPDQALATGLDEDEIEALRPKPFPIRILSSEAISWFLDAISEKIIEKDELSGLQLETVSPEDVRADVAQAIP